MKTDLKLLFYHVGKISISYQDKIYNLEGYIKKKKRFIPLWDGRWVDAFEMTCKYLARQVWANSIGPVPG